MRPYKRTWLRLVALLAVALLAFAACGEDEEPQTDPGGGGDATKDAGAEFTTVKEGVLTVGSDIPYPPFEFQEEDGTLSGFDVELTRDIAERIGLTNTDDDWISTDFGTIFQQLQAGNKFDVVIAAVTAYAPEGSPASEVVADRRDLIDFTDPYYPSLQSLTVDTSKSDVTSIDELPDGARIAVQAATTGAFFAEENLPNAELVEFNKAPGMFSALQAGQVEGIVNDLPVSLDAISDFPNLEVVEQLETGEEYGIAVSKDNPGLKEAINGALAEMFEDGTYEEIFTKYFPEQVLPDYAS
ncbi:MAG: ABC transporter substrate-binding protein [Actinomycetota bacterium]